jgi:DNA-binding MarR family transcriptional regulator/GNAT superfamily N-acetyltransferase
MTDDIDQVRRFNRVLTQRIGALTDEYLGRDRPLGASRVLWEVARAECGLGGEACLGRAECGLGGEACLGRAGDVKTLRDRLDLDSGYLSRLLRRLETDELVVVEPDPDDRRARVVRLTDAGRAETAELDRRSDDLARSMLAPLSPGQRARLVEAMATVERLLTAGLVQIAVEDPTSQAARLCLSSYFAELDSLFDAGFDPELSISATAEDLIEPAGLLLVARLGAEPVGCGALKLHGRAPAELKRMWVAPKARGLGVGRRILGALEQQARDRGAHTVRLETNRALREAIALYRSSGYTEVAAFNAEPYADHWFSKRLR